MAAVRVKLNDEVVDPQPEGIDSLTQEIGFSEEDRLLGVDTSGSITFWSSGFDILWQANKEGVTIIPVRVQKESGSGWVDEVIGEITLSAVRFNREERYAEATVEDASVYAKVRNNFQTPISTAASQTKLGTSITAISAFNLSLFNPATGVRDTGAGGAGLAHDGLRVAYDLKDFLEVMIKVVSDNGMNFSSTWYDGLPDVSHLCVVTGHELRTSDGTNIHPEIQLVKLWKAVAKAFNLVMYPSGSGSVRTLNIETRDSIEDTDQSIELKNVLGVLQERNQSMQYASVKLGGKTYSTGSYPDVKFRGSQRDEFFFQTDDNIDGVWSLQNDDVIFDTNTIEDVILNDVKTHDDEVFLINYTASNGYATIYDPLQLGGGVGSWAYSEQLMNHLVMRRYDSQGNTALASGDSPDYFKAVNSQPLLETNWPSLYFFFDDDCLNGVDLNSNYDAGAPLIGSQICAGGSTFAFTAPEDGLYGFRLRAKWIPSSLFGSGGKAALRARVHRNGAATPDDTQDSVLRPIGNNTPEQTDVFNLFVYLQTGDTASWSFQPLRSSGVNFAFLEMRKGSSVELITAPTGEGIFQIDDGGDYKDVKLTFDRPLSDTDRRSMVNNPTKAIKVTDRMGSFKGFPDRVGCNILNGATSWDLRSSRNLIRE